MATCGSGWRFRTWDAIRERRQRISWRTGQPYFVPKDSGNTSWVPVPRPFKADAKKMIRGKVLKTQREAQNNQASHDLWQASRNAFRFGDISEAQHCHDKRVNQQANQGKHTTTAAQWNWAKSTSSSSATAWADLCDEEPSDDFSSLYFDDTVAPADHDNEIDAFVVHGSPIQSLGANKDNDQDLESFMPTDLDRFNETQQVQYPDRFNPIKGALPELAAKLNRARASIEVLQEDGDFGHLQTFYLPRISIEANISLQAHVAELDMRISSLEKENFQLDTENANLKTQLGMKDVMLDQLFRPSFSCDRNLVFGSSSGMHNGTMDGFSPYLPLAAIEQSAAFLPGQLAPCFSSCGPLPQPASLPQPALGESEKQTDTEMDSRLTHLQSQIDHLKDMIGGSSDSLSTDGFLLHLEERSEAIRTSLHNDLKSSIQNDVNQLWQLRLDAIQNSFQRRLDHLDDLEARIPDAVSGEIRKNLYDERLLQLSKRLQELSARVGSWAVADDSAIVQPALEEIRSELHGSIQTLRHEFLDKAVDSDVLLRSQTLQKELFDQQNALRENLKVAFETLRRELLDEVWQNTLSENLDELHLHLESLEARLSALEESFVKAVEARGIAIATENGTDLTTDGSALGSASFEDLVNDKMAEQSQTMCEVIRGACQKSVEVVSSKFDKEIQVFNTALIEFSHTTVDSTTTLTNKIADIERRLSLLQLASRTHSLAGDISRLQSRAPSVASAHVSAYEHNDLEEFGEFCTTDDEGHESRIDRRTNDPDDPWVSSDVIVHLDEHGGQAKPALRQLATFAELPAAASDRDPIGCYFAALKNSLLVYNFAPAWFSTTSHCLEDDEDWRNAIQLLKNKLGAGSLAERVGTILWNRAIDGPGYLHEVRSFIKSDITEFEISSVMQDTPCAESEAILALHESHGNTWNAVDLIHYNRAEKGEDPRGMYHEDAGKTLQASSNTRTADENISFQELVRHISSPECDETDGDLLHNLTHRFLGSSEDSAGPRKTRRGGRAGKERKERKARKQREDLEKSCGCAESPSSAPSYEHETCKPIGPMHSSPSSGSNGAPASKHFISEEGAVEVSHVANSSVKDSH